MMSQTQIGCCFLINSLQSQSFTRVPESGQGGDVFVKDSENPSPPSLQDPGFA